MTLLEPSLSWDQAIRSTIYPDHFHYNGYGADTIEKISSGIAGYAGFKGAVLLARASCAFVKGSWLLPIIYHSLTPTHQVQAR